MHRSEIIRYLILRSIGNFLLLFAIFGVFMTFGPALYYEAQFRIAQMRGINYQIAQIPSEMPKQTGFGKILEEQKPVKTQPGFAAVLAGPKEQTIIPMDTNFGVVIPKIGANARVIPNIDAAKEDSFLPALRQGVAHAKGTVFPGQNGTTYLFAHSTDNFWDVGRYNAVFYLLKDLAIGDQIVVFFENRRYNYTVTQSKIVDPSDVSLLVNSHKGEQRLALQTCWPPGTTWKRLIVIATPKK